MLDSERSTVQDADIQAAQRALLERLLDLTIEQEHALNAGDMQVLRQLSDVRSRAVQDAAAYLPPRLAWDPSVADLAAMVYQRSDGLQVQLRQCMAHVRRQLAELSKRQQLAMYFGNAPARRGASWKG
jgi:hypothetical protein